MTMKDRLWATVPATLKNNDLIEEYIEVVADVFDEIRQRIHDKRNNTDYTKAPDSALLDLGFSTGLDFPRNISDPFKRQTIRDAGEIFSRLGTRNSLHWALKLIGFEDYNIFELWAPNPDVIRRGYYRNLGTQPGDEVRYTITENTYTDFVLGEEYVTSEGTFFRGFTYESSGIYSQQLQTGNMDYEFEGIPIYGEKYKNINNIDFDNTVAKTSYMIIRVESQVDIYNSPIMPDDYVDPETGDEYEYTPEERRAIINQLIGYFVDQINRTAITRIYFVSPLWLLESNMPYVVDKDFVLDELPAAPPAIDYLVAKTQTDVDHFVTAPPSYFSVGSNFQIGVEHPYPARGMYMEIPEIPQNNTDDITVNITETRFKPDSFVMEGLSNNYPGYVFLDRGANVTISTNGPSVDVFTMANYFDGISQFTTNVDGTQTLTNLSAHAIRLRPTSPQGVGDTVTITVSYPN